MARADWIIDLGPGAGHDGGRIVFEGTAAHLVAGRLDPDREAPGDLRRRDLSIRLRSGEARGERPPLLDGERRGSSVSTWMQTWSAPASRCSWTRAAIVASSPHTTRASTRRSLPPSARSSSVNPWRFQLFE